VPSSTNKFDPPGFSEMSYETESVLPKGVSVAQAVSFALLLGYKRHGTYAHLGSPKTLALYHFEDKDYRSWQSVELSISSTEKGVAVGTRTNVGRSAYDFEFQNRTVREFKRRFGGRATKDDGDGAGYDPGPPVPPPASGCYLSMRRFDWHLSRLEPFLGTRIFPKSHKSMEFAERAWRVLSEANPEVFSNNIIVPYVVSMMEDFFKSTYIALLRYSDKKATIFKNARLSGEQLANISKGVLTVEEAVAETMSFQRVSAVARHFKDLDPRIDISGALKKPYRGRKTTLFQSLDDLTTRRHALIHRVEIDISLRGKKIDRIVANAAVAVGRIYKHVTDQYGWFSKLNGFNDFSSQVRS
jgi:hypothetical protein